MNHFATAGRTRLPDVRAILVVLTVAVLGLCPSTARAATAGAVGATAPAGAWPLQPAPAVVRGFDPPSDPWGSGHRGVDLAGVAGQQVHAALGGVVSFAGQLAGRGVVVVDDGTTRTTYEPVRATVSVGDAVAEGAVIGTLEVARSHCWPAACLHWGWIRDVEDVYLDPLLLVGLDGPVRLLPLWRNSPAARAQLPYADWRPMVGGRTLL